MADFDFDMVIDRREVPALKHHRIVLGQDGMDLFPAGVADMDFRVAPSITEAITRRAAHGLYGYEAVPDGLMPALTNWLRVRHGWTVDPAHILRAPNVLNILAMAVNLFTAPGKGIIVQPPVFFDFADIIAENGRRMIENPLVLKDSRYQMDFDALEHAASHPDAQMIFLCNPHNPVGRVWTREELARLATICRRHDVLVVSDEIHGDITFPGHSYTPLASLSEEAARNSITCLSPAKSFNIAACCSAFTVVPDENRRRVFQAENSRLTVNKNNAFASVAMAAAYARGGSWLNAAINYIGGNLDLVRDRLAEIEGVDLIEPDGTFLIWLDFRDLGLAPDDLTTFLRQRAGWSITRGIAFGPQGAGFGRLNIACPRARLAAALDRLQIAVKGLHGTH
ncbi:MAG: putative C-S lyase [Sulfitobacter sp.]|nr:putative C-S lyase [Sulfitobacter sp.]